MVASGAVVGVCGLAGCLSGDRDVERTVTETYTADELTAIAVETTIGDVAVETASDGGIDIEGQKAAISRDDLEMVGLEATVDDGVLELSVDHDESRSLFGLRPDPVLDLSVAVPEELSVERVESGSGAVDATDVVGDLTVITETGDVTLAAVDGTVSVASETGAITVSDPASIDRLTNESGDVTASIPGLDGDATIETTTGAVELRLPDRLDLTLDLTTDTGEITVSDVADLPEMAGDSLIEAVIGDGTHRLEVTTERGDVMVTGREQ